MIYAILVSNLEKSRMPPFRKLPLQKMSIINFFHLCDITVYDALWKAEPILISLL